MKYLSVCSGIEAASVAWHPLGWTPVAFSEIEAFPSAVLAHHYPNVQNWGDLTKFKEWPDATFDVLVGGTPCQSFSVAGLRKGLADPRGNLALTYLALADRYRPEWLVWENVPGVLSADEGEAFGAFLGGLGELGYGWAYRVLDAQYWGLAQRRKRVFVVASSRSWQRAAAVLFDSASLRGDSAPRREAREGATPILEAGARTGRSTDDVRAGSGIGAPGDPMFTLQAGKQHGVLPDIAGSLGSKTGGGGMRTTDLDGHGAYIPEIVGTLSDGAHMGGGLTDRTPTPAASLPSVSLCLNAGGMGRIDAESETLIPIGGFFDVAHSLRAEGFDASEDGTGRGTPLIAFAQNSRDEVRLQGGDGQIVGALAAEPGMKQTTYIAFSVKDHGADAGPLSPTLRSGGHDKSHANGGVMPAIAFDARQSDVLQYGEKTGPLDTDGHTMGVLAFDWKMGEKARSVACSVDQSPTLGAQADRYAIAQSSMQVRRLTPRECERLQGFSDDYTLIPYRNKPAADGPRYKALGNSMAVPCMAWIGRRIQTVSDL